MAREVTVNIKINLGQIRAELRKLGIDIDQVGDVLKAWKELGRAQNAVFEEVVPFKADKELLPKINRVRDALERLEELGEKLAEPEELDPLHPPRCPNCGELPPAAGKLYCSECGPRMSRIIGKDADTNLRKIIKDQEARGGD